jgi:hypothetical protein
MAGESIYVLRTMDDRYGEFGVINNQEAFITALTASNVFIQPVCTVNGSRLADQARSIITEKAGTAYREGNYWKIQNKAIIHYE